MKLPQQHAHAGTDFAMQQRSAAAYIDRLRGKNELRHHAANDDGRDFRRREHDAKDVAIEHSLSGDSLSRGGDAHDALDGRFKSLPVMRAGTPDECSIDIEKDERHTNYYSE